MSACFDDADADAAMSPTAVRPSSWEEYRAAWTAAENRRLLTDHPLHLDMELAGACNLKCAMCWQSGALTAPLGTMDDDLFKRVVDEGVAMGLRAIKLQSRGESMLHPHVGELARYAKEAGVMDVQLTTNGTLFAKPGKMESIVASGLDKLIFSIDESHDVSAREVYRGSPPDVRDLFRQVYELRERLGLSGPKLRVQTFAPEGVTQEERLAAIRAEFPFADEYLVNVLWNSNTEEDSVAGLGLGYDFLPCSYLWTRMVVFWNGDVTTCCRDYNGALTMGNVRESSIRDIWLGARMTAYRRVHAGGKRRGMAICGHCDVSTRRRGGDRVNSFIHLDNA